MDSKKKCIISTPERKPKKEIGAPKKRKVPMLKRRKWRLACSFYGVRNMLPALIQRQQVLRQRSPRRRRPSRLQLHYAILVYQARGETPPAGHFLADLIP